MENVKLLISIFLQTYWPKLVWKDNHCYVPHLCEMTVYMSTEWSLSSIVDSVAVWSGGMGRRDARLPLLPTTVGRSSVPPASTATYVARVPSFCDINLNDKFNVAGPRRPRPGCRACLMSCRHWRRQTLTNTNCQTNLFAMCSVLNKITLQHFSCRSGITNMFVCIVFKC